MRVVVTVCTRERPDMLRACLESLVAQVVPDGLSLELVVVENDECPCSAEVVAEIRRSTNIPMLYAHEPTLGIPFARNLSLSLALQRQPDWIGFIDDDETAAPDWLASFYAAANAIDCDVLQGPVEPIYPEAPSSWMKLQGRKHQPTGRELRTAATSNTFMRARLACPTGLGLRFNEAMRFTGGSDNAYFSRAAELGARICWSDETLVYEVVAPVRTTLRWQLSRAMRVAANTVTTQKAQLGLLGSTVECVPKYVGRLLGGLLLACVAAPAAIVLGAPGKRLLGASLRDLASAVGGLGAYCGFQLQPYRVVDRNSPVASWWGIFGRDRGQRAMARR